MRIALVLLLVTACPASAAEPAVTLPAELKVRPGRLLQIRAETAGKVVKWFCPDSDNADLLPYPGQEKTAIFCSPVPGKYRVFAFTAAGDVPSDPAVCCDTVGDPPPPAPPNPPTDPLTQTLQAAYAQEPAASRSGHRDLLQALYRQAARDTVNQPGLKTLGDLHATLLAARQSLLPEGALGKVREAIAAFLDGQLPRDPAAPLTPDLRGLLTRTFTHVADSLGGLHE